MPDDDALAAICRRHRIRRLALFSSTLEGANRSDSDVDLLVEFEPAATPGLMAISAIESELSALLGGPRSISGQNGICAAISATKWRGPRRSSSKRDDTVRIRHMIEAPQTVQQFIEARRITDFHTDTVLLFAVARAIEILGEAASRVSPETRSAVPQVPWQAVTSIHNRLIHAYFDIDPDVIWTTAAHEIPALLPLLLRLVEAG